MSSTIQLTNKKFTPVIEPELKTETVVMPHLQPSNRKHSQESIETKISENSDSLEIDANQCTHQCRKEKEICMKCGTYFSVLSSCYGVKSQRYFGQSWDIQNLRQTAKRFQVKQVKPLDFVSKDVIQKTSLQFGFGLSTQALGVYIYYTVFEGKNQFVQVVISLFVAAKLMEHTNIKSLRRYRKYLNKCFSYEDYQIVENYILQKMDYDLLVPTFMDFIFTYLHRGIVTSDEICNVVVLEDLMIEKAKQILFKGTFMMFPPEVVASNLLFHMRNKVQVKQPWNKTIQKITDLANPYFIFQADNKKIVQLA